VSSVGGSQRYLTYYFGDLKLRNLANV